MMDAGVPLKAPVAGVAMGLTLLPRSLGPGRVNMHPLLPLLLRLNLRRQNGWA